MAPTSFAKPLSPAPPSARQQHRPSPEVSRQVLPPLRSTRLLDQTRERIRLLHYSRGGLRLLVPRLHPLSRPAPSVADGRGGGRGVPSGT
jgi:hypothetical protein